MQETFSLDEAATLLNLPIHVVRGNFDDGRLRGWRVPGTGERRVARHHLIDFTRDYHLPPIEQFENDSTVPA